MSSEREYNHNDRVLVTQPPFHEGRPGVVDAISRNGYNPYFVRFPDSQTYGWFDAQHLAPAETTGEHLSDKLADDLYQICRPDPCAEDLREWRLRQVEETSQHPEFSKFLGRVLEDPEAAEAFRRSQARRPITPAEILLSIAIVLAIVVLFVFVVIAYR